MVNARSEFLERSTELLEADPRIVAAWLAGSFGRQEQDEYSDVDLWAVVRDEDSAELCARTRPSGAGTVEARRRIISGFGEPAIIHEHHANAPQGGSFTTVIYRSSGLAVDWTFIPLSGASRDPQTVLLYDAVGIRSTEPRPELDAEEKAERLAERFAFFWMIAVPAAKAWRRGDGVRFHGILEMMYSAALDIEHLLEGTERVYTRRSLAPFCPTSELQYQALVGLTQRFRQLAERVEDAVGVLTSAPDEALLPWLER